MEHNSSNKCDYFFSTFLILQVDVYSLGNIFYMLLQKDWPFREVEEKEAKRLVKDGYRPSFDAAIWNSTDPIDMVLKKAMIMCHEQVPEDRASARHIEVYLKQHLQNYSQHEKLFMKQ